MENRVSRFLMLLFLAVAQVGWAMPYQAGPYTVDVAVRNTVMSLIPDAKVSCWQSGKVIKVEARAKGYIAKAAQIQIQGNQKYYKYDFALPDVEKKLHGVDLNGKAIPAVYFEKSQIGFPANTYGITAYIPKESWPKPMQDKVDVFDTFWGVPLAINCVIAPVEDFYQVKLTITRRAVDWTPADLLVVFDTRKRVSEGKVDAWLKSLARLERSPRAPLGGAAVLAKFIRSNLPMDQVQMRAVLPATLKAHYQQARRFAELHRDAP